MDKDDFEGFGYRFSQVRDQKLDHAEILKKINVSKLVKNGVDNYYNSKAGEDGYYRNGDPLVALKWYNAYLSDNQLLLIDRMAYTSVFGMGGDWEMRKRHASRCCFCC